MAWGTSYRKHFELLSDCDLTRTHGRSDRQQFFRSLRIAGNCDEAVVRERDTERRASDEPGTRRAEEIGRGTSKSGPTADWQLQKHNLPNQTSS